MKTPFARRIGMNICALRIGHDWSQNELCAKVDVDISTVQRWECGCVVPDGFDVYKLSIAFGVGTDAIYKGLPKSVAELHRLHPRRCAEHSSLS